MNFIEKIGAGTVAVIILALSPVIVAPVAILDGWVLSKMWGWFIVGRFHLPPLSIPVAIGLALTVRFLTHQHAHDERKGWQKVLDLTVVPLMTLFFGYLLHLWMLHHG